MPFRHLAIEGPPGVGKTALADRLGTRLDAARRPGRHRQSVPRRRVRPDGPARAFQAQLFSLLARHRQQQALRQGDLFTPDDCRRLPVRQGQDLRVSRSRRQRAVHLSAAVRPARARRPAARPRGLSAGVRSTWSGSDSSSAREGPARAGGPGHEGATCASWWTPSTTSSSTTPPRRCSSSRPRSSILRWPDDTLDELSAADSGDDRRARGTTCRGRRLAGVRGSRPAPCAGSQSASAIPDPCHASGVPL